MVRSIFAALLFAAARPASAAPALSFEQSLGHIQQQLGALRAAQVQAKTQGLAERIERAAMDASNYYWEANRLRNVLQNLRWRAQRLQNPDQDAWFRMDLDRFTWDLRDLAGNSQRASADVQDIANQAQKDPALVGPAQNLSGSAQQLRSETNWLQSDGQWAAWDFRRLGLELPAWDVETESRNAADASSRLEEQARALLAKVR